MTMYARLKTFSEGGEPDLPGLRQDIRFILNELSEAKELAFKWERLHDNRTHELTSERAEWCAMFGAKHPPGKPLSPKDARLLKAIFTEVPGDIIGSSVP